MSAAAPPPSGPPPDLPHDTLQPNIIASGAVTCAIATIFVALRFYTRRVVINALNSSDWCILIALIFALGTGVGEIEEAIHGSGRHLWDLDLNDAENGVDWARAGWFALLFYTLSLCFSKASILLLYIHVFTFPWLRRAGQLILAIVVASNIYMVVTVFTACIPLQSYWDPSVPSRYCHPQAFWWASTGLLMVTDYLIFLLPMPVLWILKLPRRQKWVLLGIFSLGFFVCFISILRLTYLVKDINDPDPDFFYATATLDYWTMIEVNGAIVCACLMTLKPLAATWFPRFFSSTSSNFSKPGSDNWVSPPTIGSKPSKNPLSSSKSPHSRRGTSLDEFQEDADRYGVALELEDAMVPEDASTASLTGADDGLANAKEDSLSPPPRAHLNVIPHTDAHYGPSPDPTERRIEMRGNSQANVVTGKVGRSNMAFYDSSSERAQTPL